MRFDRFSATCVNPHALMLRSTDLKGFSNLKFQISNRIALGKMAAVILVLAGTAFTPSRLSAQDKPNAVIPEDCSTFAISPNNRIAFAVAHMKRVKKVYVERDDVSVADLGGKTKPIVERDKFMPVPPPVTYIVNGLAWSPDGRRLAMTMTTLTPENPLADVDEEEEDYRRRHPEDDDDTQKKPSLPPAGKKVVALIDDDGHEIKVSGSKTRFIEDASNGAWLADGQTAVYLTGPGPYRIARVRPSDGQSSVLFEGHTFDTVVWDTPHNQAFAISQNLSLSGKLALLQLDLVHEGVREVARVPNYQGQLTLSSSGKKIGFFIDGDTIEVHDVANPTVYARVRTGPGKFEFGPDDERILLKRNPVDKSGTLVWVGLADNSFVPILHGLEFHDFEITPDGNNVIVMDPGKGELKVYPLR